MIARNTNAAASILPGYARYSAGVSKNLGTPEGACSDTGMNTGGNTGNLSSSMDGGIFYLAEKEDVE